MIYKLGILGCSGRMGLEICGLLADEFQHGGDSLELSDAVSKSKKLKSIEGVSVRNLADPIREPVHAWIDFSRPEGTVELLRSIDTPIVIGTTGFDDKQLAQIESYAKKHPVLLASNTSPGMNLVYRLLEEIGNPEWATETVLFEEHHRHKKDSPSGTAKEMLKVLEKGGVQNTQVLASRGGMNPGLHSIRFLGEHEEVEIVHRVRDRKVFAQGALLAVLRLIKIKEPGLYGYSQLMEKK